MGATFSLTGLNGFYIFLIGLASVVLYLGLFRWLDVHRDRKDQLWTYIGFFCAGWFSILPTSFMYGLFDVSDWLESPSGKAAFYYLINGPVEELGKLGMFILLIQGSKAMKEPLDGLILGACVGLGFAVAENFSYAGRYGDDVELMLFRSITSFMGHPVYTAFTASVLSFGLFGLRNSEGHLRWPLVFLAWLPLSWIHSTYNFLTSISPNLPFVWDVLWLFILGGLYFFMREQSPYKPMNLTQTIQSQALINRGLKQWPESPTLNRRAFLAAYFRGEKPKAADHWKQMDPLVRSNEVRRLTSAVVLYLCLDKEKGLEKIKAILRRHPWYKNHRAKIWSDVASFFPKGLEDLSEILQSLGTLDRANSKEIRDKALLSKGIPRPQNPRQVTWALEKKRRQNRP